MRIPKFWETYERVAEHGTRTTKVTGIPPRPFSYRTAMPTAEAINKLAAVIGHADAKYVLRCAWEQLKIDNRPNPDGMRKTLSTEEALNLQRTLIRQYLDEGLSFDDAEVKAADEVSAAKPADTINWITKDEAKKLDQLENAMLLAIGFKS